MSFSTFSGPIRTGTVRYGSNENMGLAVLEKAVTLTPGSAPTLVFPAGSIILIMLVDTTTAFTGGTPTATLTVTDAASTNYINVAESIVAAGRIWLDTPSTTNTHLDAWWTMSPSADTTLTFTMGGNATAGVAVCNIWYAQQYPGTVALANPATP